MIVALPPADVVRHRHWNRDWDHVRLWQHQPHGWRLPLLGV